MQILQCFQLKTPQQELSLKIKDLKKLKKILTMSLIVGLVCIAYITQKSMQLAPLIAFLMVSLLPNVQVHGWMKYSFFVYCNHQFFVRIIRKLLFMVLGASFAGMLTSYIIQILLIPTMLIVLAVLLNKFFPKVYKISMGAR